MPLKIYNSLTRHKENFKPISENKIKLYVCGNTVYDFSHIGHARSQIAFDVIVRYLRWRGYVVNFVRNITDIDDKIINRAAENQETVESVTERFIRAQQEDEQALGLLKPDHEPRATQFIAPIIALIEKLLATGAAYVADNGDVCFAVRQFKEYGQLSGHDIEELISGARVQVSQSKQDPLDFVLWKLTKPDEPQWSSPWGEGRPGWHIECSAMATELLGQPFDIHGGGMDLKFPHHENEIAQSEAANKTKFANYWMHVGLLTVDNEKMSKSLKNFITVRDCLKHHQPEVLRYLMLCGHYRSPINYSEAAMQNARSALMSLYNSLRGLSLESVKAEYANYKDQFIQAMDDDFNTPEALAVLFNMSHEVNRYRDENQLDQACALAKAMQEFAHLLGLLKTSPQQFMQSGLVDSEVAKIETLIAARNAARAQKKWAQADQIRDELIAMGVSLEDSAKGTLWRKE